MGTPMDERLQRIARIIRTCPDCGAEKPLEEDVCRFCELTRKP